ncbi:MAG TPA: hypothetical protein VH741_13060 [Candidatus Limnocylindrales bacterium]
MDRRAQVLAVMALFAIGAACLALLWLGAGGQLPGGTIAVPGTMLAEQHPVEIPLLAPLLVSLGLMAGSTLLVEACLRSHSPPPRLVLAGIGLAGASLAALVLQGVGLYDVLTTLSGKPDPIVTAVPRAAGVAALIAAVALALLPLSIARRHRTLTLVLAAAPFTLPLVPFASSLNQSLPVSVVAQALAPDFPPTLSALAWVAAPIHAFAVLVGLAFVPLGLWQAVVWARASAREAGYRLGGATRRWPALLAGLAAAKLAWLLLGFGGLLPIALGGRSPAWESLRAEGAFAWAYGAGLLIVAALVAPAQRRRPISDRRAERAARWTVAFFWSFFACAIVLATLLPIAQLLLPDDTAVQAAVAGAFDFLLDHAAFVEGVVMIGALLVGLVLLARGRRPSAAVFLVVAGAWTLPRAIAVISDLAPPELAILKGLPLLDAPGLQLMDLLVTGAILAIALAATLRPQRFASGPVLALALAVSTLLAHGGTLLPLGAGTLFFAVALVFPVAYELSLDSEALNRLPRQRAAAVLGALGLRAAVLALVAVAASVSLATLLGSEDDDFAKLVFALPISVIIVVAAAQASNRPAGLDTAGDAGPHVPSPRRALAAALAGLIVVGVSAAVLRPLDGPLAPFYPTPADQFASFDAERGRLGNELGVALSDDAAQVGDRLLEQAAGSARWLTAHPPARCFATAWEAQADFVATLRRWALLLRAADQLIDGAATATGPERDEVSRQLESVSTQLQADVLASDTQAAEAAEACRGPG